MPTVQPDFPSRRECVAAAFAELVHCRRTRDLAVAADPVGRGAVLRREWARSGRGCRKLLLRLRTGWERGDPGPRPVCALPERRQRARGLSLLRALPGRRAAPIGRPGASGPRRTGARSDHSRRMRLASVRTRFADFARPSRASRAAVGTRFRATPLPSRDRSPPDLASLRLESGSLRRPQAGPRRHAREQSAPRPVPFASGLWEGLPCVRGERRSALA